MGQDQPNAAKNWTVVSDASAWKPVPTGDHEGSFGPVESMPTSTDSFGPAEPMPQPASAPTAWDANGNPVARSSGGPTAWDANGNPVIDFSKYASKPSSVALPGASIQAAPKTSTLNVADRVLSFPHDPVGVVGNALNSLREEIGNYTEQGREDHPILAHIGDVLQSANELLFGGQASGKPMGSREGVANNPVTAMVTAAPGTAETAALAQQKLSQGLDAVRAARAAKVAADTGEWQRINDAIGVTAKTIRIGRGAATLEDATTMPGRTLAKLGYTADQLEEMHPLQQMAAIMPKWQEAGQAVDIAVKAASNAGKTLDAGDSAFDVLKQITDSGMQNKAIATFNDLAKQAGITNQRAATPEQVLQLRRSLQPGARFGPTGDLNSLGAIRANLYRAVSSDLQDAVPSLKKLDQTYSDLEGAMKATQAGVQKFASQAPPPTMTERVGTFMREEAIPAALKYGLAGALGYGVAKAARHTIAGGE